MVCALAATVSAVDLLLHTLRGMATQRRALPIALVAVPMLLLEGYFAGARGALLAIAILGGFLLLGPASYRTFFPVRAELSPVPRLARVLVFASLTAAYVLGFGVLLPRLLAVRDSILSDTVTLYGAAPLFWAGSWALGRDIEWEASLQEAHARNDALARAAERSQLLALRTHLDPHFLFNTLNAIAEWCRQDPLVAERATLQLSSMLRTILSGVKAPAWPLASELELVRQLLDLHRARDPGRFSFTVDDGEQCAGVEIPPLLLLSLVENAIKHGPAAGHAGEIALRVQLEPERLRIELSNPGPFLGPRPGSEGLPIVEKRLQLAYDGRARMSHESDGKRTAVQLELPLRVSGDAV